MSYPNRVKVARACFRLSQEEFAEQYNVSVFNLKRWEDEVACPPIELAAELALRLRVKLDFILGHEYEPTREYAEWYDDQKEEYEDAMFSEWHDATDYFLYAYGKGKFTSSPEYVTKQWVALYIGRDGFPPHIQQIVSEYAKSMMEKYNK